MKQFTHIVGTRPQIIKLSAIFNEDKEEIDFKVLDTSQHFDDSLQKDIYDDLKINTNLIDFLEMEQNFSNNVSIMTDMITSYLVKTKTDYVIVYGDTNTTLAGALASKLADKSLIHIESGLRSYESFQIEEANRKIVDSISDYRLCPTKSSLHNLKEEGLISENYLIGDLTLDVFKKYFKEDKDTINNLNLIANTYYVATIHRHENTSKRNILEDILESLNTLENVYLLKHPSLVKRLSDFKIDLSRFKNIHTIDPLTYTDMLNFVNYSKGLITDSGGLQKDAFWLNKKVITLRNATEWKETLINGENILVSNYPTNLGEVMNEMSIKEYDKFELFGSGNATKNLIEFLKSI